MHRALEFFESNVNKEAYNLAGAKQNLSDDDGRPDASGLPPAYFLARAASSPPGVRESWRGKTQHGSGARRFVWPPTGGAGRPSVHDRAARAHRRARLAPPVVELVLDFWRAAGLASAAEQRGLQVVCYPQSDARMIPASGRLHQAIVDRRLRHPDDEGLNWHVSNGIARRSRRVWRIDRPGGRARRRGDRARDGGRPRRSRRARG